MNTVTDFYLIRCLTNLHAGSGDSTYGIVDKEVQRDPIAETPVIHASGIKGAWRELFEYYRLPDVITIFGSDTKANSANGLKAGQYFFMEARMLFLPVRSSRRPFFYATSPEILHQFIEDHRLLKSGLDAVMESALSTLIQVAPEKGKPVIFSADEGTCYVDEFIASNHPPMGLALGDWPVEDTNIAVFHHDDLKEVAKRLPVIARNHLESGISSNLWYEEVVPRETLFYHFISRPETDHTFSNGLQDVRVDHTVQIGGNASVGYGLCKYYPFPKP